MTLALKDAYQIKLVPAFQTADGTRFHDADEARKFTRDNMLKATISSAVKHNPQFAKLDPDLLREFLLLTGKHVGAVMAEPLDVVDPRAEAEVPVTNTPRAGETQEQTDARLRSRAEPQSVIDRMRAAAGGNARPTTTEMPQTKNPDIFQNTTLAAARAVDEAELDSEIHEALTRSVG